MSDLSDRIRFHAELDVMEADFSNLVFDVPATVHQVYDLIETRIAATRQKWYFMVNYGGCKIEPAAWMTWAARGKRVNKASSLGSVRFDASPQTAAELETRAETDDFDPNLCASREAALARIADMRSKNPAPRKPKAAVASVYTSEDFAPRIGFDDTLQVMDADFSDFTFASAADVNAFYDFIESQVWKTGKQWFFLVNYRNCRIWPEAWATFAMRGKRLNLKSSLGSVRYDASPENTAEIERRAETENFDPNLCASREAGLARIAQMRAAQSAASPR